jgi:hypothetical protein
MMKERLKKHRITHAHTSHKILVLLCAYALVHFILGFCGCAEMSGYSSESLFPDEVSSVCLEMFDNRTCTR